MFDSVFQPKKYLYPSEKTFIKLLKRIVGFTPRSRELYQLALVHKSVSFSIFKDFSINNERLEYLGDAVLGAIIAEYLFKKFPEKDEGFLTQMRSKIVNRENLNHIAIKLGIPNIIKTKLSGENHKSLYGDALEALIGALYLDKGFKRTKEIVLERIIYNHINLSKLQDTESDFKSRIIEWGQKNKKDVSFSSFEEQSDNNTVFVSHLIIVDEIVGRGVGSSKKEAEQNAAKQALKYIDE
ncbi:MAG TPA: ribonuclease III [Bacteroidales bacterium]|nr:ribonuclease III [Bacteroidales bacterium]